MMSLEYIFCVYLTYNSYMSYLIRTGTGRNNISYGGGKSTKAKYLRRTGTGRTNISWIDINSNGTYNVLERTNTGRNNIRWYNTTFSFVPTSINDFGIKTGMTADYYWTGSSNSFNYWAAINSISGMSFSIPRPNSQDGRMYPRLLIYPLTTTSSQKSAFSAIKRVSVQEKTYTVESVEYGQNSMGDYVQLNFNRTSASHGRRASTFTFYTS